MKTDHAQHLIMAKKQDLDHLDRDLSPVCNLARVCSVRYRYSRYRYGCTKLTEVSAPVWMSYRIYRSVRYRY